MAPARKNHIPEPPIWERVWSVLGIWLVFAIFTALLFVGLRYVIFPWIEYDRPVIETDTPFDPPQKVGKK